MIDQKPPDKSPFSARNQGFLGAVQQPAQNLDQHEDGGQDQDDEQALFRGRGMVVPDSFTHGSSQQRVNWFMKGLKSGNPNSCDTFNVAYNQL